MTQTQDPRGAPTEGGSGAEGTDAAAPRGGGAKWIFVLVAALALAGGVWAFLASFHPIYRMWVHGATKKEYRDKLAKEQDPDVVPLIEDGMRDDDLSDATRIELAKILLEKNRVGLVEKALKDPRLDVRVIAVRVLSRTSYFRKSYVDDDSYRVSATVTEWLLDPSSRTRDAAADLVSTIYPNTDSGAKPSEETLNAVRALVALPPGGAAEPTVRAAAARTLAGWQDCGAAEAMLARAATEQDYAARFRILQSVTQLYDLGKCGGRIPEQKLLDAIDLALAWEGEDGLNRAVRMSALSILAAHPKWAEPRFEKIRSRLLDASVGEPERGEALQTLVSTKDPVTLKTFARWFHDPAGGIRATAVRAVLPSPDALPSDLYESAIVGFLRDEPYSAGHNFSLQGAYQWLKNRAGVWVGLPAPDPRRSGEMSAALRQLFEKGEAVFPAMPAVDVKPGATPAPVTRAQVAAELWRWLAAQRGVKAEEIPALEVSRDAFWLRAKAGDVAGAKAILDPLLAKNEKLWTYEKGWLLAQGRD